MQKKFAVVVIFLAFVCMAPLVALGQTTQPGKNLVTNPGFEDGLAGWSPDAHGSDGSAVIDDTVSHTSKRSLRFTNKTKLAPNVWYRVNRTITAQPFTTYRISCWVKGEDSGNTFIGGGPGWAVRLAFPVGTFDWKQVSMEWSTGASAEDFELMLLSQDVTKKCWVDDVEFVPIRTDEAKLAELRKTLADSVEKEKTHLATVLAGARQHALADDVYVKLGTSLAQRFIDRIDRLGLEQNMSWSTFQIQEVETVLNWTQERIDHEPAKLPGVSMWPGDNVEIRDGVFETKSSPVYLGGYGHFDSVIQDLPNFRDLGVNLIQDGRHGPSNMSADGLLDAGAKGEVADLKRAAEGGVKVDVLLSPHFFPQWAYDQSPDVRNGNIGFIDFNIDHPKAREAIEKWLRVFVPTLKDQSALLGYCLSNEPAYVQSGKDKYSRPKFVQDLQGIHGDIAKLNALYGTNYKSFDDVAVPNWSDRPKEVAALRAYWDWCRFNQIHFADWHRWMNDIVKSIDAKAMTHVKALVPHTFNQSQMFLGVDPELMCEFTDVAGCDNFVGFDNSTLTSWPDLEFYYDWLNSFRDQPVFNSELHFIPDGFPPQHIPGENSRAVIWQGVLHHLGANTIWVWNEPGPGLLGSIYLRPANIWGVSEALLDANRLSREVTLINRAKPRVALLYSQPSIFWEAGYGGAIMNLHAQLKYAGEKVTFISERQLAAGVVPKVDVILTSRATHVADATVEGLRKFAGAGGKVIFCGDDDLKFDEYHRPRTLPGELQSCAHVPAKADLATFAATLRGAGLESRPLKNGTAGADVSGVEYRIVEDGDAKLVPLMNFNAEAVTVALPEGMKGAAVDLLSGLGVESDKVELKPMVPMLLRVR